MAGDLADVLVPGLCGIGESARYLDEIVESINTRITRNFLGNTYVNKLLDTMPELIGTSRTKLLSITYDAKLRNIIDQVYRPGASIGDGGTASILAYEYFNGTSKHLQKARDRLAEINKITGDLKLIEYDIIDAIKLDLEFSIKLFD